MQRIRSKCLAAIEHVVATPFVHQEGRKWGTVGSDGTRYFGPCETSRYIKLLNNIGLDRKKIWPVIQPYVFTLAFESTQQLTRACGSFAFAFAY
jgi:hypothetical protein